MARRGRALRGSLSLNGGAAAACNNLNAAPTCGGPHVPRVYAIDANSKLLGLTYLGCAPQARLGHFLNGVFSLLRVSGARTHLLASLANFDPLVGGGSRISLLARRRHRLQRLVVACCTPCIRNWRLRAA